MDQWMKRFGFRNCLVIGRDRRVGKIACSCCFIIRLIRSSCVRCLDGDDRREEARRAKAIAAPGRHRPGFRASGTGARPTRRLHNVEKISYQLSTLPHLPDVVVGIQPLLLLRLGFSGSFRLRFLLWLFPLQHQQAQRRHDSVQCAAGGRSTPPGRSRRCRR